MSIYVHVKIPVFEESTLIIETPLVLLVANISTVSSGKPAGSDSMSTEDIADPVKFAFNIPESIVFLVIESTMTKIGGFEYPSPLLIMFI